MYKNYIFDLYGTLIDINTDEWNVQLWKKMQILYGYRGAIYTYRELQKEYGKLIDKGFAAGFPLGRYYADRRDQLLVAVTEKRSREEIKALANAMEAFL